MQNLFALLSARYPRAAQCAAALGMTRQAYSQSQQRRRLSESKAMLAAILLEIDPAQALLANYTAANDPTAPELDTTENPTPQPPTPPTLYYVKSENAKVICPDATKKNTQNIHYTTSTEQEEALDLIRWVYAVARLPADSPRFNWYVSRWAVPEKIAMAKAAGWFSEAVSKCPPIDPAWIRLVPAALAECEAFKAMTQTPYQQNKPASSSKSGKARNSARLAA